MNLQDDRAGSRPVFEQGPIRPPNEAFSLLIRVTRNCPWNRCTFCPVYKESRFSARPVEEVKEDIDAVHKHLCALRELADEDGTVSPERARVLTADIGPEEVPAFTAAAHWLFAGYTRSVFLQDADSLIIKTPHLVDILTHLKQRFPWVSRVTSYSRSQTVARKREEELRAIRESGLSRIHVGLESGADEVLRLVRKGATKELHITAGRKAKASGLELSEYIMPGLGGRRLSAVHARETADALNAINPHFIRIRSLAIRDGTPLSEEYRAGRFEPCTDVEVAKELLQLIEGLDGIRSVVRSDHILNLFADLEGELPRDKRRLTGILRRFLEMGPEQQRLYQVGRRLGILSCLSDLDDPQRLALAEESCRRMGVTPDNVDAITARIMQRFV